MVSIILRGEGIDKVIKTMTAIINGVRNLCARNDEDWTQEAWKNVTIVVICDGEQDVETSALFGVIGAFNADMIAKKVDGRRVTGDLYEVSSLLTVIVE